VRRVLLAALILTGVLLAAQTSTHRPLAIVAEFDGIIHPVSAEYLTGIIDQSDAAGADVVIIVLRTPGGLLDSTRDIVSRMIRSRAPVVVFVGPAGGRAASAGFILTLAADVAVMAPGTHIGAAHPVSGTGQAFDEVSRRKQPRTPRRTARSLAEARGRNVMLAAEAVQESRAIHRNWRRSRRRRHSSISRQRCQRRPGNSMAAASGASTAVRRSSCTRPDADNGASR
jgi:membrane-bound serine protease (ClpP class)